VAKYAGGGVAAETPEYDAEIAKYRKDPGYTGYEDYAPSGRVALNTYNDAAKGAKDYVVHKGTRLYSKSAAKQAQDAQREYNSELRRETRGMVPKERLASGGKVKAFAKGGAVSASRRGDGIAQRGKTRGRVL
jgi:hypothetical protein